jgi:hypothetical protein
LHHRQIGVVVLGFQAAWEQSRWIVLGSMVAGVISIIALILYCSRKARRAVRRCLRCGKGKKAHAKVAGNQALDPSVISPMSPLSSPRLTLPPGLFKPKAPSAEVSEKSALPSPRLQLPLGLFLKKPTAQPEEEQEAVILSSPRLELPARRLKFQPAQTGEEPATSVTKADRIAAAERAGGHQGHGNRRQLVGVSPGAVRLGDEGGGVDERERPLGEEGEAEEPRDERSVVAEEDISDLEL